MGGSIGYETFLTEMEYDTKTAAIEMLLNTIDKDTTGYRYKMKHRTENKWFGTVTRKLVNATSHLSDVDCFPFYDRNRLITVRKLEVEGWISQT